MTARSRRDDGTAALYALEACRSPRCNRVKLRWVPTSKRHPRTNAPLGSGKPIPLDVGRDPHGLIVVDQDPVSGAWLARALDPVDDPARPRYSVHWQTCNTPDMYQAVRAAADPSGKLPPIGGHHYGGAAGPCAGCGATIRRYGPGGRPLCDDCALPVVRRWPASMQRANVWALELLQRHHNIDGTA